MKNKAPQSKNKNIPIATRRKIPNGSSGPKKVGKTKVARTYRPKLATGNLPNGNPEANPLYGQQVKTGLK